MITKVKQIHPLVNIRRERVLPVPGQVLIRRMQKVSPSDVVVSAPVTPSFILMDIAKGLNVNPTKADEFLQRQSGDELSEGDVIAGPVGLFQRVVRAPGNGVIRIAGDGKVLFEMAASEHDLLAGLDGTVTNIIPDRGAILETKGTLIQGVWGNGRIAYGVIQPVDNELNQELQPEDINISFRGSVMIAGYCTNPEVFKTAEATPIKGLVLGSMLPSLIPVARQMPYPIIVLDQFGSKAMNAISQRILVSNRDRNIALNAQKYDHYQGVYPEVIISLPSQRDAEPPLEIVEFSPGQQVIILSGPHASKIGRVESIPGSGYTFPSGIKAQAVEVSVANESNLFLPQNNVRVIIQQEF
jgi:transcription antitermination factor NusG